MSTRSERDKQKSQNEKHQMILSQLLKEEDNKYCVDCDAKGPRWASWNLGVFLCIRCAGIHRNLGVHISKVKSVNLDSWTPEQIAMMQDMGNSKARAVYEANLQDHFRRPQTDSSLEAFIRAKYEAKKYIAKEWIPTKPKFQAPPEEKKEKKKTRPRPSGNVQLAATKSTGGSPSKVKEERERPVPKKNVDAAVDLLGLDSQPAASAPNVSGANGAASDDLFTDFLSANTMPSGDANGTAGLLDTANTQASSTNHSTSNQGGESLFGESGSSSTTSTKSTKDSILALYGPSGGSNQQMFGGQQGDQWNAFMAVSSSTSSSTPFIAQSQFLSPQEAGQTDQLLGSSPPTQTETQSYNFLMSNDQRSEVQSPKPKQSSAPTLLSQAMMMSKSQASTPQTQDLMPTMSKSNTNDLAGLFGPTTSQQQDLNMGMFGMTPMQQASNSFTGFTDSGMFMPQQQMYMGNQMGQQQMGMPMMSGMQQQNMGMQGMNQQVNMMGYNQQQQSQNNMMQMGNMGGGGNMYNMQQQQMAAVQNQMGNMHIGGQGASQMMNYPQQNNAVPAGAGWGQQQTGQTLSTNLWQ